MVIYADIVFLINFLGNFLCLWLLSEVNRKIPVWRRILAAAIGGIYGLLCTNPQLSFLHSVLGKLAIAAVMVATAYIPMPAKPFIKSTAMLFMASMLLAGGAELTGVKTLPRIVLAILGTACLAVCATVFVRSGIYAKYLPCELCFAGRKTRFLGFYDSGNRLISGENSRVVIVGDERILKKLVSNEANIQTLLEWTEAEKIVTVPFSGAASGVMRGIVLDYAKVGDKRYDEVVLAFSETKLNDKLILHSIMS